MKSSDRRLLTLLLEDLVAKTAYADENQRAAYLLRACLPFLPDHIQAVMPMNEKLAEQREPIDVALVCVTLNELLALKAVFGIAQDQKEDRQGPGGIRYWVRDIPESDGRTLRCSLSMVGSPGNVACTQHVQRMLQKYNAPLCILCGIAGGLEGGVSLGDVVAAEIVIDYEYSVTLPEGQRKRPRTYTLDRMIGTDLEYYEPTQSQLWEQIVRQASAELNRSGLDLPRRDWWTPRYERGVILSGEKLRRDGQLQSDRESYHDRIRAVDMESAGFADACSDAGVPWLVFRGISDYADPEKDDSWQVSAAVAAVAAARAFLASHYRRTFDDF